MKHRIKESAKQVVPKVIEYRRHLHKHPELSFKEYNTQQYIIDRLKSIGINNITPICKTGVIAIIEGQESGATVALRADLDALPIQETNPVSYASVHKGIMHACGHDVHTSSLLGACEILYIIRHKIKGSIKLIFQPGEEMLPGGASLIIKEKGLENPKVNTIIGQHVFPELEAGKVGFRSGIYMASSDEIYITINGVGGHAALPQKLVDPILISAHVILALQQIVSRNTPQSIPTVLSFGQIKGLGATNIIPQAVNIAGTLRTMDESHRNNMHKRITELVRQIASSMGGKAVINIKKGYPVLENNELTTNISKSAAIEYLGEDNVVDLPIRMTSEDFAFYTQETSGCFYRLGTKKLAESTERKLHSSTFDIDESCLEHSSGLLAYIAMKQLE